jgi:hypothetical protein
VGGNSRSSSSPFWGGKHRLKVWLVLLDQYGSYPDKCCDYSFDENLLDALIVVGNGGVCFFRSCMEEDRTTTDL